MRIEPFGTFHAPLSRVEFRGDTPRGHRIVGPILGSRLEGPFLQASQVGVSAADWLVQGPDGTVLVDVRVSLQTDDEALLQLAYQGRAHWAAGVGSGDVFAAFAFDTDDPRYRWLCARMVVGVGKVQETHGSYSLGLLV